MPGYWMYETTGILKPAVHHYLHRKTLSERDVAALRAYFRQWMEGDWAETSGVQELRRDVDKLLSREAIEHWLDRALAEGIDPL